MIGWMKLQLDEASTSLLTNVYKISTPKSKSSLSSHCIEQTDPKATSTPIINKSKPHKQNQKSQPEEIITFCYERDFMTSLSIDNQPDIIEAFNSTSRNLGDLHNIDNPYFEGMCNQIYPPQLKLNKDNTSDTEAPFLDLHLSISNSSVSSKIYGKRDDFFRWRSSTSPLIWRSVCFSTYNIC